MKEKKQDQLNESTVKVRNKWSLYKNKGKYGDYYSLKKGDLKISINAKLLEELLEKANRFFDRGQSTNSETKDRKEK